MNREIKFRGKRKDNGKWIYGYYIVAGGMAFISTFGVREPIAVIPETVGQFTGLHDKNGVKIYEGDKLVITQSFQVLDGEVIYHEDTACYRLKINEDEQEVLWYLPKEMEVIGNVHEKAAGVRIRTGRPKGEMK